MYSADANLPFSFPVSLTINFVQLSPMLFQMRRVNSQNKLSMLMVTVGNPKN